jgi:hypothetical protein
MRWTESTCYLKVTFSIHWFKFAMYGKQITLQRVGTKQCCIDDASFQWEWPIFRVLPTENPLTNQNLIWHSWWPCWDDTACQRFTAVASGGRVFPVWGSCSFWLFFSIFDFFNTRIARTGRPIATVDGLNDAVRSRDVAFGVALITYFILGLLRPKTPYFCAGVEIFSSNVFRT